LGAGVEATEAEGRGEGGCAGDESEGREGEGEGEPERPCSPCQQSAAGGEGEDTQYPHVKHAAAG